MVPIRLGAGVNRNFINAELWGKATMCHWAMVISGPILAVGAASVQLYQFAIGGGGGGGGGGALFVNSSGCIRQNLRRPMAVSGTFCVCYGILLSWPSFVREPRCSPGVAWPLAG